MKFAPIILASGAAMAIARVAGAHGAAQTSVAKHGAFYAYSPRVPGCKPGFSLPLQR